MVLNNVNPEFNTLVQKPYDEQWHLFISAYQQSIKAFGYGALQNLFCLQKCLTGPGRESVRYLLTGPKNINDLLEDLEFRFGRTEQLIHNQITKISQFDPISEQHIERYVDYSSLVQNTVDYLNKEKSRHFLGEIALMSELVRKMPPSKQLQ